MGKNDITWEVFFSDDSRYADIINAYGCNGRQLVQAQDLSEVNTRAVLHIPQRILARIFGGKNTGYQRIRDSLRRVAFGINFMLIGIESQETVNYKWPLTCMEYDVAEYEKQAAKLKKEALKRDRLSSGEYLYGYARDMKLHPTVTFLIYSGEAKWDAPVTLKDMLDLSDIPAELADMVQDYKPYVIDVRHLENTDKLKTDVKQVFDFIRCCENREKLVELVDNDDNYKHLTEEAFDVMAAYTNSKELELIKQNSREEGDYNMCKAIKDLIADSKLEGRLEGRLEGEKRNLISQVCRKMAKGKTVSEIAYDLDEDELEIESIYSAALKCAPQYDVDKILADIMGK